MNIERQKSENIMLNPYHGFTTGCSCDCAFDADGLSDIKRMITNDPDFAWWSRKKHLFVYPRVSMHTIIIIVFLKENYNRTHIIFVLIIIQIVAPVRTNKNNK